MSNITDNITNINEKYIYTYLIIVIIIVFSIMFSYYLHTIKLNKKQCDIMDKLYPNINGKIHSINKKNSDFKYTLKDYYIKTAYNCCSGGEYKHNYVSLCNLKAIIRNGVRCLDFELYSINNKPIISTSTSKNYFIKETYNYIDFSQAMYLITNYAFSAATCPNPSDPLIIHLRIKSNNHEMYSNLTDIFKSYNNYLLGKEYSYENYNKNLGDTPLLSLLNKIIIIVDRSNISFMNNKNILEYINMTSNSIFMRLLNYNEVKYTPDMNELVYYNKKNITLVMPDIDANPSNPSGILSREYGCQMIAMRYNQNDPELQENNIFFENKGSAFILKPERLRYITKNNTDNIVKQNPELSYQIRTINTPFYKFNI